MVAKYAMVNRRSRRHGLAIAIMMPDPDQIPVDSFSGDPAAPGAPAAATPPAPAALFYACRVGPIDSIVYQKTSTSSASTAAASWNTLDERHGVTAEERRAPEVSVTAHHHDLRDDAGASAAAIEWVGTPAMPISPPGAIVASTPPSCCAQRRRSQLLEVPCIRQSLSCRSADVRRPSRGEQRSGESDEHTRADSNRAGSRRTVPCKDRPGAETDAAAKSTTMGSRTNLVPTMKAGSEAALSR